MGGDVERVVLAAAEAGTLRELGERTLPTLARVARASSALLYRYDDDGALVPIAGDLGEVIGNYTEHYLHTDPVHEIPSRLVAEPRVVLATRVVDRRAYERSAAYGEFYRTHGLDHVACAWLTRVPYAKPGMIGMMFARPRTRGDFDADDQRRLGRALPALSAATARAARLRDVDLRHEALEALAASAGPARLVLAARARVVWASPACEQRLGSALRALPDVLTAAAQRLFAATRGQATPPRLAVAIPTASEPIAAQLSLIRTASGAPLVLVELAPATAATELRDLARQFGLTPAETVVLGELACGLRNAAIAARLGVSIETVRTHVRRVLAKLGARTRVEAAVIATERAQRE
jgi:DNA-binding CsgD family transcriptional regulator